MYRKNKVMKTKGLFLGIILCGFSVACGGGDGAGTPAIFQAPLAGTALSFGTETIDEQVYIEGITKGPVILPEATGVEGDLTYSLAPLPDGLIFDSGTRVLSGFPTVLGSTGVTYTATDVSGKTAELTFNMIYRMPQTKSICSRTQQVEDAILAEIHKTDNTVTCDAVNELLLAGIIALNLSEQGITSLQADDFDDLAGLRIWLRLRGNDLTTLPEDVFEGLSNLGYLDLSSNMITTLPEDLFDGLSSLTRLELTNNDLTTLSEDVFEGLSSLRTLHLANNDLTVLPEDVFEGLSGLSNLFVRNNDLTVLPEDVFEGLSDLYWLDLGSNMITVLPEDVFDELSNLGRLHMSGNMITTLSKDVFEGLTGLTELYMSNNDLTALPENVFDELTGLTHLRLSNNDLTALPEDVFDGLSLLFGLELDGNTNLISLPAICDEETVTCVPSSL